MKDFKVLDDWVEDSYFKISTYLCILILKLNVCENILKM